MGREDWLELAYWTCVAGALLTYVVLAHVLGIVAVGLFFG